MAGRLLRYLADLTASDRRGEPGRFAVLMAIVATPLVLLLVLRLRVVDNMAKQFRDDPTWREIRHEGNLKFTDAWFATMRARDDVAFVVPLTRALSREVDVGRPGDPDHTYAADLVVTGHGDPRLGELADKVGPGTAVISERLRRRIGLQENQDISVWAAHSNGGSRRRPEIRLRIAAVARSGRIRRNEVFVPLEIARDIEDVNVGVAVPERGWPGTPRPATRAYASFRISARDIDDVPRLEKVLLDQDLNVTSDGALATQVFALDRHLTAWFWGLALCSAVSVLITEKVNQRQRERRLAAAAGGTQPGTRDRFKDAAFATTARIARLALGASIVVSIVVVLDLGLLTASAYNAVPRPDSDDILENPRCADIANVLDGTCSRGQLVEVPPEQATRLASNLLRHGGDTANQLALALLQQAWTSDHYAQARLELAKLYDPMSFAKHGPLTEPNAVRALELYEGAAAAGVVEAAGLRARLIGRLRSEAARNGPSAQGAGDALRDAGIR